MSLAFHVAANLIGIGVFLVAGGSSALYVLLERRLRQKKLGLSPTSSRLPPLEALDRAAHRLLLVGFPLFTLGVVTGSIWAARLGNVLEFSTGQGFALLAWVFFACVLLSRAAGGWRGRRAAIGTMLGFLCALAAIGGYVLRGVS